ncbi:hypothetical protein SXCC_00257 [Gluconacetobacter sp. SXCC-1]|nr:hypothetical protein SXCC_00257 [Gluconacetobacter sp. SXCC-1]
MPIVSIKNHNRCAFTGGFDSKSRCNRRFRLPTFLRNHGPSLHDASY